MIVLEPIMHKGLQENANLTTLAIWGLLGFHPPVFTMPGQMAYDRHIVDDQEGATS